MSIKFITGRIVRSTSRWY